MMDAFSPFDTSRLVKWFVVDRKHDRVLFLNLKARRLSISMP